MRQRWVSRRGVRYFSYVRLMMGPTFLWKPGLKQWMEYLCRRGWTFFTPPEWLVPTWSREGGRKVWGRCGVLQSEHCYDRKWHTTSHRCDVTLCFDLLCWVIRGVGWVANGESWSVVFISSNKAQFGQLKNRVLEWWKDRYCGLGKSPSINNKKLWLFISDWLTGIPMKWGKVLWVLLLLKT